MAAGVRNVGNVGNVRNVRNEGNVGNVRNLAGRVRNESRKRWSKKSAVSLLLLS